MPGSADTLHYVTRNPHKFREAYTVLERFGIQVRMLRLRVDEIQDMDVVRVARFRAEQALRKTSRPVLVEDSGLYIKSQNGFPGALSSHVYRMIGVEGILKLMAGVEEREAQFRSAVVYARRPREFRVFTGRLDGSISKEPVGSRGFGFDPIFVPKGETRTLAQMNSDEKNTISHRAKALVKFANYFLKTSS
jgi:XTP/dITP diphosphohydrolase